MVIEVDFVPWSDLAHSVINKNQQFAKLFDEMVIQKGYQRWPLMRIRASYGESFIRDGKWEWDTLVKFIEFPKDRTIKDYQYSKIPLALLVDKSIEVWTPRISYVTQKKQLPLSIPRFIALPGDFIGLYETYTDIKETPWFANAGIHTLFIASPIQQAQRYGKFNRSIKGFTERIFSEEDDIDQHWAMVSAVARKVSSDDWKAEVIVFDSKILSWLNRKGAWCDLDVSAFSNTERQLLHYFICITCDKLGRSLEQQYVAYRAANAKTHSAKHFSAARMAAHIHSILVGQAPVIAPITTEDEDMLPVAAVAQHFYNTPLHDLDKHHLILMGAHRLDHSRVGYLSIRASFTDFDWPREQITSADDWSDGLDAILGSLFDVHGVEIAPGWELTKLATKSEAGLTVTVGTNRRQIAAKTSNEAAVYKEASAFAILKPNPNGKKGKSVDPAVEIESSPFQKSNFFFEYAIQLKAKKI